MEHKRVALFALSIFLSMLCLTRGQKNPDDSSRQLQAAQSETTTADFIRLLVMRLIFGVASAMGFGENLSNFLGGILVPPGVDYEDDYDFIPDFY